MQSYADIRDWYLGLEQLFLTVPDLAPLKPYFLFSEADRQSPAAMRNRHHAAFEQLFSNPSVMQAVLQTVDFYQREILGVPALAPARDEESKSRLGDLTREGFCALSPLAAGRLAEMRAYLEKLPVYRDPKDRAAGSLCPRDEIRDRQHVGILDEQAVVNCPHFLETVLDDRLLGLVGQAMGAVPTLINLSAWWSFAHDDAPREAQLFHLDLDDHRFFKLFIYLNDVDADGGPHCYVPGSHDIARVEQLIRSRGERAAEIARWYKGQLRKSDQEVADNLGLPPLEFEGPAGTMFLVNTFGLHKGVKPRKRDRLLLQATFGCTPALQTPLNPVRLGGEGASNLGDALLHPPKDYIARYYLAAG